MKLGTGHNRLSMRRKAGRMTRHFGDESVRLSAKLPKFHGWILGLIRKHYDMRPTIDPSQVEWR
jgi:hypothetical protein